ncbi:PREDICTED: protein giant-like [Nicrophorus vespilloides]|uniref:Protein giant-like n=1 Tax=Nicrophorus vespilloides TaxID=110193 RepID=A0ABM1MBY4_NICVS|nr:PREDICTED: protein giant-like [Nicrophorus vespilloides]
MEPTQAVQSEVKLEYYPMDYSSPVLDLTVRKRSRTPEMPSYQTSSPQHITESHQSKSFCDPPTTVMSSPSPTSQSGSESSEISVSDQYNQYMQNAPKKIIRPFKAYPKDPLAVAIPTVAAEIILGHDSDENSYANFRQKMLSKVQNQNMGTNIKMRRNNPNATGTQNEDPTYWEKRRKNNEAAKRSRDARRAKEDEIAIRCAYLEQENLKLRYQLATMENENKQLRVMIYNE